METVENSTFKKICIKDLTLPNGKQRWFCKAYYIGINVKKTNKQKRGFGLRDGLLRGILSDSFPSKAITVKLKSDESSTTVAPAARVK